MLRTVLVGVLIISSLFSFSQYSKKYGVGIQYNMLMLENDKLKDVAYEYQPVMASAFTKLFQPEMKSSGGKWSPEQPALKDASIQSRH